MVDVADIFHGGKVIHLVATFDDSEQPPKMWRLWMSNKRVYRHVAGSKGIEVIEQFDPTQPMAYRTLLHELIPTRTDVNRTRGVLAE